MRLLFLIWWSQLDETFMDRILVLLSHQSINAYLVEQSYQLMWDSREQRYRDDSRVSAVFFYDDDGEDDDDDDKDEDVVDDDDEEEEEEDG